MSHSSGGLSCTTVLVLMCLHIYPEPVLIDRCGLFTIFVKTNTKAHPCSPGRLNKPSHLTLTHQFQTSFSHPSLHLALCPCGCMRLPLRSCWNSKACQHLCDSQETYYDGFISHSHMLKQSRNSSSWLIFSHLIKKKNKIEERVGEKKNEWKWKR